MKAIVLYTMRATATVLLGNSWGNGSVVLLEKASTANSR